MRQKIDNQRDARRCLRAAERPGLTAGEWAREHGIDGRSLNAWRMNLALRAPERSPADLEPRLVGRKVVIADEDVRRLVGHLLTMAESL